MDTNTFLETIYTELKALGLVGNQYDFSVMCGRTPSWFSTLKARNLLMTTDAALTLSYNIREHAGKMPESKTALALSEQVMVYAQQRIAQKLDLKQAGQLL
jgi:hypothetical protein